MIGSLFQIVVAQLWEKGRRTALTCAGVAIGTATLVFLTNMASSLTRAVENRLDVLGSKVIIVSSQVVPGSRGLSMDDAAALRHGVQAVEAISPFVQFTTATRACGTSVQALVIASGPVQHVVSRHHLRAGRLLSPVDETRRRAVAVISRSLAARLRCLELSDQFLFVQGYGFAVVGIVENADAAEAADTVYIPFATLSGRMGARLDGSITMVVQGRADIALSHLINQVQVFLRRRHRIAPETPDDFLIKSKDHIAAEANELSERTKWILGVIVGWSFLIAGVGIANSVLNSVLERTAQIGLRRAVGAKRRDIRLEFLLEAGLISGTGATGGILVGAIAAAVTSLVLDVPLAFDVRYAAGAVAGGIGLGVLAGMWPAMHAARLNPATAMRAEN